ncbi:MAG TPA: glycosyl transferase [candidate division Zixibacteria bacterium]|nr:glycosyl transferase [candidate division Zixibacteria bacterium]
MKYGYFDDARKEYVITNPKTPTKWINYVGTLEFGGFVDHTGGALLCRNDPALNRITKYIPQLPASDFKGTTLYLRIEDGTREDPKFRVFSPYFVPSLDRYDSYQCHVGLGYTRIVSEFHGLRSDVTIFVPIGEHRLIRDIKITNISKKPLKVDVIPVVEYSHPDALAQFNNADWVPQTMQSKVYEADVDRKILLQFPFMLKDTQFNFMTSNLPVSSFESDRKCFLGDNEYGTWSFPLSLRFPELSNREARRGDIIGALLHHLGQLEPGDSRRVITQLGQASDLESELPAIRHFWGEEATDDAFNELGQFWEEYLSRFQVETVEESVNSLLNVHNPRQCYITKNWSRYLSIYQLGLGARGIGFRDSSQDVLGILGHAPLEGKKLIKQLLRVQKRDGSAMHQYNPLSMEANEGDSREVEDGPKYYSDDHLWVVLAIVAYLKETGDLAFLDDQVPFYEKGKDELPLESGSIREHIKRAIDFTRTNKGAHGLPLLGFADWNDTMNLAAGAESLFTACLYGKALLEMKELAEYEGDESSIKILNAYHQEMKSIVNDHCWDGSWYIRYFDGEGRSYGSKQSKAGQIYANAQSWPIMAGFATNERARLAMEAVRERLNTTNGVKLSVPGYDGYDAAVGGVSTYPPGAKENGGIFLHANPWIIIAETLLGNGDRAFSYYNQINPAAKNDIADQYECEPYVYPQNILGDEHPQFGLARNSWLTGTASWMFQAATQYILGIQPTFKGLRIDPCIPVAWDRFRVRRVFRGGTYEIMVSNPDHVNRGIRAIEVDSQAIDGNILPVFEDETSHQVKVIMG